MDIEKNYVPSKAPESARSAEEKLAISLGTTKRELAHAECFDDEQRAEVYTILETLESDGNAHMRIVGQWIGRDTHLAQTPDA